MNHMELNPVLIERLNDIHDTMFKGARHNGGVAPEHRIAVALFLQAELPEEGTFEGRQLELFMERAMYMRSSAERGRQNGYTEGMRRSLGNQMRVLSKTFPDFVPDEDTVAHGARPAWVDDVWQKVRGKANPKTISLPTKRPAAPGQGQENAPA